jgi:hypothetical protein
MTKIETFSPKTAETLTLPGEPFNVPGVVRYVNYDRGFAIVEFKLPSDNSTRTAMLSQKCPWHKPWTFLYASQVRQFGIISVREKSRPIFHP